MGGLVARAKLSRWGHSLGRLDGVSWAAIYWWRLHPSDRQWLGIGAVAASGLAAFGLAFLAWQQAELDIARQRLTEAQEAHTTARRMSAGAAKAGPAPLPWWDLLPVHARRPGATAEGRLGHDVLMAASAQELRVNAMRFSNSSHVPGSPYRTTALRVELIGPYPSVKGWLREVLGRRPHDLVLRSLDIRRPEPDKGSSRSVEATVELGLLERVPSEAVARQDSQ